MLAAFLPSLVYALSTVYPLRSLCVSTTCLEFQVESLQADNDFTKEQLANMKGNLKLSAELCLTNIRGFIIFV